jgi:hypothetical protein
MGYMGSNGMPNGPTGQPMRLPCAHVWYEWRYAQRVTTVSVCGPCCNAGLLRAVAEGCKLAEGAEMAPSFEDLGCWG